MIALSWSRISDYRQCPHKFNMKYLRKEPNFQLKDDEKSPQLVRGGNVHKGLDTYVIKKLKYEEPTVTMPEILRTAPLIDQIIHNYSVKSEQQIAINDQFQVVSWYAKDAWFRVIYDLIGLGNDLLLVDWKTGKFAEYAGSMEELGQLHMAAVVGMTMYPDYEDCSSVYVYVDHRKTVPCTFKRSEDYEYMRDQLIREHEWINKDQTFIPRKNQYCRWCDSTFEQCKFKK